jgi:heptosyltransferase-1
VNVQSHAVQRSRELCARALGYALQGAPRYGLDRAAGPREDTVVFVHGTSREDKCWPEEHWIALGQRLLEQGHGIGLPHGSEAERERSQRVAQALGPRAEAWPRLSLDALAERMGRCAGAIGVDSGLSHIAVALDLPHVQVYNFDTAWRTGPFGNARQRSVFASPAPSVDAVWQAWQEVAAAP